MVQYDWLFDLKIEDHYDISLVPSSDFVLFLINLYFTYICIGPVKQFLAHQSRRLRVSL